MVQYLICKTQEGEGCDYTIGCGMTYELVDFDGSFRAAVEHFTKQEAYPDGEDEGFGLHDIEEFLIVQVGAMVSVDVAKMKKDHEAKEDAEDKKAQEEKEREEYNRLHKKFSSI